MSPRDPCVVHTLELDELVAMKFIRPDVMFVQDVTHRFAREAKASARINSEHVARVLDIGQTTDFGPFICMEYLDGSDLSQRLASQGPFSVTGCAQMLLQACEALAIAHSLGITHRDIKPANLFVAERAGLELIKVLDFGISKVALTGRAFGDDCSVIDTSYMLGTPLYMSPEQIRGSGTVDHRSDIWSLGVTLRELLSGVATFKGETMTQVCARVLEHDPPPLSSQGTEVPEGLQEVIDRCLEKDPERRYQDVAELAEALVPFAGAGYVVHAQRASRVLGRTPMTSVVEESRPPTHSVDPAPISAPSSESESRLPQFRKPYARVMVAGVAIGLVAVVSLLYALLGAETSSAAESQHPASGLDPSWVVSGLESVAQPR